MTRRDLFVVVADLDAEEAIKTLLSQRQAALRVELDFDPELEAWVWTHSPHVAEALGWGNDLRGLRSFLRSSGLWPDDSAKPTNSKEAFRSALRHKRRPRGARLFSSLARKVGTRSCKDPAFQKFSNTLIEWFPRAESHRTKR